MAVQALRHYAGEPGPHAARAAEVKTATAIAAAAGGFAFQLLLFFCAPCLPHPPALPHCLPAPILQLHAELRGALVANIVGQYRQTGYLWEQYDDQTGAGGAEGVCRGLSIRTVLREATCVSP